MTRPGYDSHVLTCLKIQRGKRTERGRTSLGGRERRARRRLRKSLRRIRAADLAILVRML